MPKVPSYSGDVRERPLPGARLDVRVTPADFGAGIGEVLQKVGADLWEKEAQKADETAVMAAVGQLKAYTNGKLYDPNNGVLNKRGKDAIGVTESAQVEYDDKISEIEGSLLSNDRQKSAYRRQATAMRGDFDLTLQRHVATEIRNYDKEEFSNFIKSSQDRAALNYRDPMLVAAETESIRQEALKFARRNGLGPQWAERFTSDTVSATHVAVIDRMLANNQDSLAREYYKVVAPALTGVDATRVEKAVQAGVLRGESQRKADEILAGNPDRADINARVRKIDNPELRDAVQQRVDAELARRDQAQRDDQENVMTAMATMIDRGALVHNLKGQLSWQNLTVAQRSSLEAYARARERGENIQTDWSTYYELTTMAATTATQDKFMKTNLLQYRDKLGDAEFKQLVQIQGALRSRDDRQDTKLLLNGMRTTKQIVDDSLAAVNIDPTPKPGSDASKRVAQFRRIIDEKIIAFKKANNREPNDTEVQELVDSLLVKGKVKGSGLIFDDTALAFEADPNKLFVVSIKDVPPNEVTKIRQALTRAGRPVTDADVLKLYNLRLRGIGINAPIPLPSIPSRVNEIPR